MKKIAIDIGHGSNTFPPSKGVYKNGKGYAEHDFNSKLARELDILLKANGFSTLMYQKPNSSDVPLLTRTNYYNSQGVDLVFSIHANYNANTSVNGRCAFYWHTSQKSKELAYLVADEVRKAGYSTHGDGTHASLPGSWTNLHIVRETKMTAVLTENGFMSGDKDFDLIFGSKQSEYIKDMAKVHAKAICRFYGVTFKDSGNAPSSSVEAPKPPSTIKPKPSAKTVSEMASEVIAGKHGNGHENRRKSLGISAAEYEKVKAEVNRRASAKPSKPKKSISQLADEVIAGKHGSGHEQRRKSLGVSASEYEQIRAEVNKRSGISNPKPKPKGNQTTGSIVVYLQSIGEPSSFEARKKLAAKHGINNYTGTAAQNVNLLRKVRGK